MSNATLIYNPVAGRRPARREKEIRQAVGVLEGSGLRVTVARTSAPGAARELAREAASRGGLVLVCGGDGTINEVINGLAPGETTLGILPGGTANIVAKELRLPHNPVRAARELPRWRPRRIPLGLAAWERGCDPDPRSTGETARRYFMSVAGVGFDAYVVHRLSSRFKMSWGVIAYCLEAIRQALRYSFPAIKFEVDGTTLDAAFAVVQRTRVYAGWLPLAPSARFFEPEFQICAFKSRNRARFFLYAGAVFARRHLRLHDVELIAAHRVTCRAAAPGARVHFELDGEHVAELPATFEIAPDALTLLVP